MSRKVAPRLLVAALAAWSGTARATPLDIELGRTLDKLGFEQAAVATMGAIVERPADPSRAQALAWLGAMAQTMPPAARLESRVAHVGEGELGRVRAGLDVQAASGLAYLEGRAAYAAGRDQDAARAMALVDRASPLRPRADLVGGAAYVRLRRSEPAVRAFLAAVEDAEAAPDAAYLRDLANLSIARTFGAAAFRHDDSDVLVLDTSKVSAAVKYYFLVDPSSDTWPSVAYELATTFYFAGSFIDGEGHARALASSAFGSELAPEGLLLRAVMQFATCRYELASSTAARASTAASEVGAALGPILARAVATGRPDALLAMAEDVRTGRVQAGAARRPIERALAERSIAQRAGYLARLAREEALLSRLPPALLQTAGDRVRAALAAERARVGTEAARALRERLESEVARGDEIAREAARIQVDIAAARRNQLDPAVMSALFTQADGARNRLTTIRVVLWPFDVWLPGDRRRLESGFFYAPSESKCGR